MSQSKDITVRVQTLDGLWETVGVDRMAGITAEVDNAKADEWGPATASFDLRRDPGVTWPDLGAFSPVEIEVGGVVVWDGRVKESPTADGDSPVVNVQCEGWRAHLDDDVYQRAYVHRKLSDWRDCRSFPNMPLVGNPGFTSAGQVTSDGGVITLGWPNGTILPANVAVGVMLDVGQGQAATSIGVEVLGITGPANSTAELVVRGSATDHPGLLSNDIFTQTLAVIATSPNLYEGDFPVRPSRYVCIFILVPIAVTLNADVMLRIVTAVTVTDPAYITPGTTETTLRAPTIVNDALDRATILLSPDRAGIDPDATITFSFDEFALDGLKTPREIVDAANAVHGYRTKVAVGRRMILEPKPAVAAIEVGQWPGCEFEDASANSGEDIYNRVMVQGTGADGQGLTVERSASQQPGVALSPITSPAADNPSFLTDVASWTASSGTAITRDTGVFDSSPASGRWDRSGGNLAIGDTLTETFTGTFLAGVTYTLAIRARPSVTANLGVQFGPPGGGYGPRIISDGYPAGSFALITVSWTPTVSVSGTTLVLSGSDAYWYIDSITLSAAQPTLVDRRGFKRTHVLPIQNSLTTALGNQIGDVWLAAHKTTPLKGTVKVTGDGAVRHVLTGHSIPPEQLLLMTGDMIRLAHRIDPDTGGQTRDGRIAEVTWRPDDDAATVAIDSSRTSHEALLQRLAVVVGSA